MRLLFTTVVKFISTKLKHNRLFILFITHKVSLENETTTIAKSSPSLFISWNEYHFLISSSFTKYGMLSFCVHCSLFIVHFLFSLTQCRVIFLYVVFSFCCNWITLYFWFIQVLWCFRCFKAMFCGHVSCFGVVIFLLFLFWCYNSTANEEINVVMNML